MGALITLYQYYCFLILRLTALMNETDREILLGMGKLGEIKTTIWLILFIIFHRGLKEIRAIRVIILIHAFFSRMNYIAGLNFLRIKGALFFIISRHI